MLLTPSLSPFISQWCYAWFPVPLYCLTISPCSRMFYFNWCHWCPSPPSFHHGFLHGFLPQLVPLPSLSSSFISPWFYAWFPAPLFLHFMVLPFSPCSRMFSPFPIRICINTHQVCLEIQSGNRLLHGDISLFNTLLISLSG
jgi:hypothetical protein